MGKLQMKIVYHTVSTKDITSDPNNEKNAEIEKKRNREAAQVWQQKRGEKEDYKHLYKYCSCKKVCQKGCQIKINKM